MRKDHRVSSQGFSPKTPTVTKNSQVEALSGNSSEVKSHATALEITDIHSAVMDCFNFQAIKSGFCSHQPTKCFLNVQPPRLHGISSFFILKWTTTEQKYGNFSTSQLILCESSISIEGSSSQFMFFQHLFGTSPFFDRFSHMGMGFQGTKLLGAPTSSRSIHQQKIRLAYRGFGPPSILVIPISMDWFVGENLQETI